MKSIMLNLIFLSLSLPVMANTVKFEFSGYIDTINSNENNALGNVYLNQSFDGWFTYSSVPDQYPSSATTGHYHQDAAISVALGTQTLSYINDYVYIRVYDNYQGEDTFSFGVDASQGDFDFTNYGVRFSDSTGVVFNNDDLPMSFDLAQFDSTRLTIAGYKLPNHDWFDVGGEITNMTLVPEPATTYYVDALNGDDDDDGLSPETAFATIQKGIDSADDGDTVIVAPGTYTGPGNRDIDFLGKAITVRSENGPENCIIDCQGGGRGFYFHNDEGANSVLAGFTITNGYAWQGGGISCYNSNPTITNCIIVSNTAAGQGGGISCWESSPIITNCTITGNTANGDCGGGGIFCDYGSNPAITNCTFSGNSAWIGGGISCWRDSSPTITNCTTSDNIANWGGGIYCYEYSNPVITNCTISSNMAGQGGGGGIRCSYRSNSTITNCTITQNSAAVDGGGISCYFGSDLIITNCILWDNTAPRGNEISALYAEFRGTPYPSTVTVNYGDVEGGFSEAYVESGCALNWGQGNIETDPCFVEPGYWDMNDIWVEGDYHLLRTSPCIDAANDANVYTDIEGNIRPFDFPGVDNNGELPEFDMGAYEAMASCFGANHLKIETKAGKKGNEVELKGTFSPALPIDLVRDDVAYIIDDGQGNALAFLIPAGSFEPDGKPGKQKFKFHSAKGSQPDIKARFDFDKCKFELKVKGVMDTSEITGTTLVIELWAGANLVEEVVQVQVKRKHLEFKREPKLSCCPKCKGIALLEVTSDQGVFVFEPEPGKDKLKRKTVVDDGVNGRVKIDTSCSKPLEVGDVFGVYTVTDLIKIFDDWPDDENDE